MTDSDRMEKFVQRVQAGLFTIFGLLGVFIQSVIDYVP